VSLDEAKVVDDLIRKIEEYDPDFQMKVKEESTLMKLLSYILFFNKDFMSGFITVVGSTVYIPRERFKATNLRIWWTLAHEWRHLVQHKKYTGPGFSLLYLFPQILAVFSLLGILAIWFSNWWLLSLLFLVCLAPLPAPWRKKFELEAYTVTIAASVWSQGVVYQEQLESIAENFYGKWYYFMWPFKKSIKKDLENEVRNVISGKYDNDLVFKQLKEILESSRRG
jgi:hypothetical protein